MRPHLNRCVYEFARLMPITLAFIVEEVIPLATQRLRMMHASRHRPTVACGGCCAWFARSKEVVACRSTCRIHAVLVLVLTASHAESIGAAILASLNT